MNMKAIETPGRIRTAVNVWQRKFARGSEEIVRDTFWHSELGVWGRFRPRKRDDGSIRYWNTFGFVPSNFRKNIIVEVNPPPNFRYGNMQGVIARAEDGSRWLLHKGQMSIPERIISASDFAGKTNLSTCAVAYSDKEIVNCYPVANIDAQANDVQQQVATFVGECHRIRLFYRFGREVAERAAELQRAILDAEAGSPELTGTYRVGPSGPRTVERRHGKVWHALARALDGLGRMHTNQRVGRWGPDLVTCDDQTPMLFEIKVGISASDLQRAIGQLFLYEKLLGRNHRKILVIPSVVAGSLASAIDALDVRTLTFERRGNAMHLDLEELRCLMI